MAQFSVKIMRPTGSLLGENQHTPNKRRAKTYLVVGELTDV